MRRFFLLLVCVFVSFSAFAQQNELSLTLGGNFTVQPARGGAVCEAILVCPPAVDPAVSVDISPAFSIAGGFDRSFANFKAASLYAEFPILGTVSRTGPGLPGSGDFSTYPSVLQQSCLSG